MKPAICCLVLTDKCMFKCKMCYKWQDTTQEDFPKIEQYKNFIFNFKELADENAKINFSGGEVLLYPDICELIKFSSENGFLTNVTSNGWLINEDMTKRIADSGLNNIFLSLDSINAQTHDFLRGVNGSFQAAIQAIEYLSKYCISLRIHINAIITGTNMDDIVDLAKWVVDDHRIVFVNFQAIIPPLYMFPVDKRSEAEEENRLWPKDLRKMERVIDELIGLKKEFKDKVNNTVSQFETFKSYFKNPNNYIKNSSCHIDKKVINITASGEIYICYKMSPIGNIKQEGFDLKRTWYSPQADLVRNNIAKCRNNCQEMVNAYYDKRESYISEK